MVVNKGLPLEKRLAYRQASQMKMIMSATMRQPKKKNSSL
jgi:hypothetical protein